MTPTEIIKNLVKKTQEITDAEHCGECIIVDRKVLESQLQELIDRSHNAIDNTKIAKMSNLLQVASDSIIQSRKELETIYNKN